MGWIAVHSWRRSARRYFVAARQVLPHADAVVTDFAGNGLGVLGCARSGPWVCAMMRAALATEQQSQAVHDDDHCAAFVSDDANRQWNAAQKSKRDENSHCSERDEQILTDDSPGSLTQSKRSEKILQPVVHQHDIGLFERSVRAPRAHGDADVSGSQTRCVIDTITDHGDTLIVSRE